MWAMESNNAMLAIADVCEKRRRSSRGQLRNLIWKANTSISAISHRLDIYLLLLKLNESTERSVKVRLERSQTFVLA